MCLPPCSSVFRVAIELARSRICRRLYGGDGGHHYYHPPDRHRRGGDLLYAVGANVLLLLLLRVLSDHFSPARLTNEAPKRAEAVTGEEEEEKRGLPPANLDLF